MNDLQPGIYNQNARGTNTCRGIQVMDQNTRQEHKSVPPWIYVEQNVRAIARENRGQNTDKSHTRSPRIEIKSTDPAGESNPNPGFKVRDSVDTAPTKTFDKNEKHNKYYKLKFLYLYTNFILFILWLFNTLHVSVLIRPYSEISEFSFIIVVHALIV